MLMRFTALACCFSPEKSLSFRAVWKISTALLLFASCFPVYAQTRAAASDPLPAAIRLQIEALIKEKEARSPAQRKLDSNLWYALKSQRKQEIAPGVAALRTAVRPDNNGRVLLDMAARVSPALTAEIRKEGGEILNEFAEANVLRVRLSLEAAERLAARPDVSFVRPAEKFHTHSISEGDVRHAAAVARVTGNTDGSGVKVGVISDSMDMFWLNENDSLGPLTILAGQSGIPDTGEGAAMLKVIRDLAPGASLYFATGKGGPAQMAANIRALQAAGCQIIVDDFSYEGESPFQDGVIGQAINEVYSKGALYLTAAGNWGRNSVWEGNFRSMGGSFQGKGLVHGFAGGTYNAIAEGSDRVTLFWADPLGKSTNDYDIFVTDSAGKTVVASSTNLQRGLSDPYETVESVGAGQRIYVVLTQGSGRFLHLNAGSATLARKGGGRILGHAANERALTVGALRVGNSSQAYTKDNLDLLEDFSSGGPRRLFYQANGAAFTPNDLSATGGKLVPKPDLVAINGVQTGLLDFNPFEGTSASAAHAAAIAALVKSCKPTVTNLQLRNILTATALTPTPGTPDANYGYGIVMASTAVAAVSPQIALLAPQAVLSGSPDFVLYIRGANFAPGCTVRINKNNRATTFVSETVLTAVIPASDVAQERTLIISVINARGTISNETPLPVRNFSGRVLAWGSNNSLAVTPNLFSYNVIATPLYVAALKNVTKIAAGNSFSLALTTDGTVWGWGKNDTNQCYYNGYDIITSPQPCLAEKGFSAIAAGFSHSLAMKSDGTVWGWGYNSYGQTGSLNYSSSEPPAKIANFQNVIAIAAGENFSLALKSDGTVWAWGRNEYGQLGNDQDSVHGDPRQIAGLTGITAIAAGQAHALALAAEGTVWAWGYNASHQVGDGTTNTRYFPFKIAGLNNITAIAAGKDHSLALKADGSVYAWGENFENELGIVTPDNHLPALVPGLKKGLMVQGGSSHSLALREDRMLFGWGGNAFRQTGTEASDFSITTPTRTPIFCESVAAGYYHNVAIEGLGPIDAVIQNITTGHILFWRLDGRQIALQGLLAKGNLADWSVVGTPDLNGDKMPDVLLQNRQTGQVYYLIVRDGKVIEQDLITTNQFQGWRVVGTPDLNGDKLPDIVFQHTGTGQVYYWLLRRPGLIRIASQGYINQAALPDWRVIDTPDINGDGKPDVLLQNTKTGQVYYWLLNGVVIGENAFIYSSNLPGWSVVAAPDLNGDGKADIVLQNVNSGQIYYWVLQNIKTIASQGVLWGGGDKNWRFAGMPDLDGDGNRDLVTQNAVTGAVYSWNLVNRKVVSEGFILHANPAVWHLMALPKR